MSDRFGVSARDDLAEIALVRRTAAWLRTDPDGVADAGLTCEKDVRAMAALLDLLAGELPRMEPWVRRATVTWCRHALAEVAADDVGERPR